MIHLRKKQLLLSMGLATGLVFGLPMTSTFAATWTPPAHVFSLDDVQGGFGYDTGTAGITFANTPTIICGSGDAGVPACPTDPNDDPTDDYLYPQPFTFTDPKISGDVTIYPLDNEFGFDVVDFVGAAQKTLDGYYTEGFVGNVPDQGDGEGPGLAISTAPTAKFKADAPKGTWCSGLGGTSIKCSTEHYTVLESVLTCNETIPYYYADENTGEQGELYVPGTVNPLTGIGDSFNPAIDCSIGALDDELYLVGPSIGNEEVGLGVVSDVALAPDSDGLPDIPANESTILEDIAVSDDYAITRKDDGKPLYRWGNMVKRPTDVRIYASFDLPPEWTEGQVYNVTKAELKVRHWITNNPNDQIRPEDMENEGATGLLPEYTEAVVNDDVVWTSNRDCYEGDGTLIVAGTVLRNGPFSYDGSSIPTANDPYPYSADLLDGFTNGWYTTVDREPFEWWYKDLNNGEKYYSFTSSDEAAQFSIDNPGADLQLVSGPRWRLLAPKYGQDLPGVDVGIDLSEDPGAAPGCYEPPYDKSKLKYSRGDIVTTTINLLDWNTVEDGPSPLGTTAGWVDASQNPNAIVVNPATGLPYPDGEETTGGISVNGAPLTPKFDLAMYIKGDQKPTVIYNAELYVEWDEAALALWDIKGVGNFDADAESEVLVLNGTSLQILNADGTVNAIPGTFAAESVVAGVGDFDDDGISEVLVQNGTNLTILETTGTSSFYRYLATNLTVEGVGDFDGNGTSDVLVHNATAKTVSYILQAGGALISTRYFDPAWSIEGVGNFDVDSPSEVLVQDGTNLKLMQAGTNALTFYRYLASNLTVEGVGDFDGNGTSDVLVHNATASTVSYILQTKGALTYTRYLNPDWNIEGVGYFSADSASDVLIRSGDGSGSDVSYLQAATGTITPIPTSSL